MNRIRILLYVNIRVLDSDLHVAGALCWNLSKVINRKDLPRIYTMCVPQALEAGSVPPSGFLQEVLPELERTRNEIVAEVLKAPSRRVDNITTQLNDAAQLLRMHAVVLNVSGCPRVLRLELSVVAVAASASGTLPLALALHNRGADTASGSAPPLKLPVALADCGTAV
jgi:hypothetical protein